MTTQYKKNKLFFPEIEKKSLTEILKFQEKKLQEHLEYLNNKSPFYKEIFRYNNINIDKIRSIEDLKEIPFTTKEDICEQNSKFYCVDKKQIIDYSSTSGTLGNPVTLGLTESDLERLAYNEAISFVCADGNSEDIYQLMTTIDKRFMAGLAYFIGIRKLGAGIIRVGNGVPQLQWDTINTLKPTTIICVPSFIIKLIDFAEKNDINFQSSSIKKAICIGEPLRNEDFSLNTLGKRIADKWDIKLYSTYASTEMAAAFTECFEGKGGHHHPELIITEFVDTNDRTIKPGEVGELVITTLGVEGFPLLRFKTGDICSHYTEPCKCGRNTIRLGPIIGRNKQMIKYKGTTIYPASIYDVLDNIPEIIVYQIIVSQNILGTDDILIKIGSTNNNNIFEKRLKDILQSKLRVTPSIEFQNPDELFNTVNTSLSRKPIKFVDFRGKKV